MRILIIAGVVIAASTSMAMEVMKGKVTLEKLEDFKKCQTLDSTGQYCRDALKLWVEKNPQDSFLAGKLARKTQAHRMAVSFFSKAFKLKKGSCHDDDVRKAVIGVLSLPPSGNEGVIEQANEIALEICSGELSSVIVSEAQSSDYVLKNSCRDLLAKKLLTGVAAKRCLKM